MKRLKEEEIRKFIKIVLKKYGHFRSLNELREKFLEEVKKEFPEACISSKRLKNILKEIEGAKIRLHVKSAKVEEREICPICGSVLKKVYIRTLIGKEKFAGVKCGKCGFFARSKGFKPSRYEVYSVPA